MTSIIMSSARLANLADEDFARVQQELNDLAASCQEKSTFCLLGGRLLVTRDEAGNYVEL